MSLAAPRCCPAERRGPSRVPWRLPALDRRGAAGAARRGGLGEPLRAEGPSTRSGKGRPAPRRGSREPLGEQAPGTRPTGGGDRRGSCCALMRLVAPLVAPYCALLRRVAPRGRDRRGAATDEAPRRGPRESLLTGSRAVNRRVRGPRGSNPALGRESNPRPWFEGRGSRTRLSAGFDSLGPRRVLLASRTMKRYEKQLKTLLLFAMVLLGRVRLSALVESCWRPSAGSRTRLSALVESC